MTTPDPGRQEELAAGFAASRARLVRIAYAVLGSLAEAEDAVADTWASLARADAAQPVRDVEAWLVVAVSRRALSVLRAARLRRESYVGPWLPEPLVAGDDPADRVTLDEQVGYALLVLLESLTPAERTAYVLHDLFGYDFGEVAQVVGRTPAAVRQLASRARRQLAARRPRVPVSPARHAATVQAFLAAAGGGDLSALTAVLAEDVVLTSDGGGVVSAARRPVTGRDPVGRFVLGVLARGAAIGATMRTIDVNGTLGLVGEEGGRITTVVAITVDDGLITRLDLVRAPQKLPTGP